MKFSQWRRLAPLLLTLMAPLALPAQDAKFEVKVLTLNIWGWNEPFETRLGLIIDEMIRLDPDIVCLQEVIETANSDGSDNSARRIGKAIQEQTGTNYDLHYRYAWQNGQRLEGVAILTKFPIFNKGYLQLPSGQLGRVVIWSQLETPFGFINYYNTHLSFGNQEAARIAQVTALQQYMSARDSTTLHISTLLSGDLNSTPGTTPMNMLLDPAADVSFSDPWPVLNPNDPGFTAFSFSPAIRIDYNLMRDAEIGTPTAAEIVFDIPNNGGVYPSDHFGVLTTIEYDVHLLDPAFTHPVAGDTVSGIVPISWTMNTGTEALETTILVSNDDGETWETLAWQQALPQNRFDWDTGSFPDGTRYKLKLNIQGHSNIGLLTTEGTFVVNNPGNAPPETSIHSPGAGDEITGAFEVTWSAGDADGDSLSLALDYTIDGGLKWNALMTNLANDGAQILDSTTLPNSPYHQLRLRAFDGTEESEAVSAQFRIDNERQQLANDLVQHVAGMGSGRIAANVVSAAQLRDHLYRLTFDDTSSARKVYNVTDVSAGIPVVQGATVIDGVSEGPLFDGLRLVIEDIAPAQFDEERSGWDVGDATLAFTVSLPTVVVGGEMITAMPYAADYRFTLAEEVVDTSLAVFGNSARPIRFSVWNETESRPAEVTFFEFDNNQTISDLDKINFIERKETGEPLLSWSLFFSGPNNHVEPEAGDQFLLATLKPFSSVDIFEIGTNPTRVTTRDLPIPTEIELMSNFPNPFNPTTTIRYRLNRETEIKLEILNITGQLVRTLIKTNQEAGEHQVLWHGNNEAGRSVSSGLYFYRLTAGQKSVAVRKMLLLR